MVRSPSYSNLKPASESSSRVKQHNRRTDTEHERMLRIALWEMGLRYRKNVETLPGKPDIVFAGSRVAIFCDGDFWHGRDWESLSSKLSQGTNPEYWLLKIASNKERDELNNALLEADGWLVIRLWETDIRRDPKAVAHGIKEVVANRHNETLRAKLKGKA